jgi:hypothetical protein
VSYQSNKIILSLLLGESIGNENPEIKSDLLDACREAQTAGKLNNSFCWDLISFIGESIKRITCIEYDTFGKPIYVTERQSMVQAARGLLSAVTRVLLLADMVVVKQIISVKKKV